MAKYKLSVQAERDLSSIFEYGIFQFGLNQAQYFLMEIEQTFEELSKLNMSGIDVSELYPGLRKYAFKSHLIFYLATTYGVFIVRVLHQSRDYKRSSFEDFV
ncbi:MAG: type II toxin-antitoxin system RelE/ParE family toxin [Cecembia sp.]